MFFNSLVELPCWFNYEASGLDGVPSSLWRLRPVRWRSITSVSWRLIEAMEGTVGDGHWLEPSHLLLFFFFFQFSCFSMFFEGRGQLFSYIITFF